MRDKIFSIGIRGVSLLFIMLFQFRAEARIIKADSVIKTWATPGSVWGYGTVPRGWYKEARVAEYLKDTTIGGQQVKKIRVKNSVKDITIRDKPYTVYSTYDAYFKYERDSIWMWEEEDNAFVFFLTFNLQVGDSIPYVLPKKICKCTGGKRWAKVIEVNEVMRNNGINSRFCSSEDTLLFTEYVVQEDTSMPLVRSSYLTYQQAIKDVDLSGARHRILKNIGFTGGFFPMPSNVRLPDSNRPPGSGPSLFDRHCKRGVDSNKYELMLGYDFSLLEYHSDSYYCVLSDSSLIKKYLSTSGVSRLAGGEASDNGIKVYPNPTQTKLHYVLPFSQGADYQVRVYSILGREVLSHKVRKQSRGQNKEEHSIEMGSFERGIYILKIISPKEGVFTAKFIKL